MDYTQFVLLLLIGLFGGVLSGTLGVGGGIIIVPALVFVMGMSQHQAQGTSLAMMLAPIGLLAAINYYKSGYINVKYALVMMLAFVVGAYVGSLLSVNIPEKILRKIFGVFMLLASLKMILGK